WPLGLKLIHPHIRTTVIKDFYWSREGQNWKEKNVPLGQGMVDFKLYFDLIREHQIKGPISMHFEYALGGAEQGSKTLSVKPSEIKAAMRKDLLMLKSWL
ncbi:MAG: sugar phosphate isomerase/epimerase, partial [Bacteroidota bacterium]